MINVFCGFLLWISATVLFRFFGQMFLIPGNVPLLVTTMDRRALVEQEKRAAEIMRIRK